MATGYELKWLDPEDYPLVADYFESERAPKPDPNFSRILAAVLPSGEVAGFIVLQLVAHAEPIFVHPAHRGYGVAADLTVAMDAYLEAIGISGVYTQPSNPAAEALCRKVGFEPRTSPLWVKVYDRNYNSLIPEEVE